MKVISIESTKRKKVNFKLCVVDSIKIYDEFVHLQKKNTFGRIKDISKVIFTDGEIQVISEEPKLNEKYVETKFKLLHANWFLKSENNSVELFVVDEFNGKIHIENKYLKSLLDECYPSCIDRINLKRDFAKQMCEVAKQLNLPFNTVLAFKGDKEKLNNMLAALNEAIINGSGKDLSIMQKLNSSSYEDVSQALNEFGIKIPKKEKPALDIANFVYKSLKRGRCLVFGEY